MQPITFTVPGNAGPQGSHVPAPNRRHGVRPASRRGAEWKGIVGGYTLVARARAHLPGPLEPPYGVELVFFLDEDPDRGKYKWPIVGDIDKLVRATLDGLVDGRLLVDDKHIVELKAIKTPAPQNPRADISVRSFASLYR